MRERGNHIPDKAYPLPPAATPATEQTPRWTSTRPSGDHRTIATFPHSRPAYAWKGRNSDVCPVVVTLECHLLVFRSAPNKLRPPRVTTAGTVLVTVPCHVRWRIAWPVLSLSWRSHVPPTTSMPGNWSHCGRRQDKGSRIDDRESHQAG